MSAVYTVEYEEHLTLVLFVKHIGKQSRHSSGATKRHNVVSDQGLHYLLTEI